MSSPEEELLVTRRFRVVRRAETGRDGREHSREIVVHPGAVTILPLFDDGRVCLIKNRRIAVGQTLIELPAGTLEPDEDPAVTAARELIEETGYRAERVEKLCEFFMSPGILNERMYVYIARGLTPGEMALEAGEQIEPLVVEWSDAVRMATDGTIEDAKSLVAILLYEQRRQAK
jgi:ADP-ribose pyrophosphatase